MDPDFIDLRDPERLAQMVFAGVRSQHPAMVPVVHAVADLLHSMAKKVEEDHMEASREFMGRCRQLVGDRGTASNGDRTFYDHRINIVWSPRESVPMMTVRDNQTGETIGSWVGTSPPSCRIRGGRLEELLDHLRSIMVLDDVVRNI